MKKNKRKKPVDSPDAFDKAVAKKAEPERGDFPPFDLGPQGDKVEFLIPNEPEPETDSEEVSEAEANAMVERAQEKKRAEQSKIESQLDDQDWSRSDPIIPEELQNRVWVAVYRCPSGHKTKATNRQARTGIPCWDCKQGPDGRVVKASMMPQFMQKPEPPTDDVEKRKKAAKGRV